MKEIELEKTYLAKYVPEDLEKLRCIEISDAFFPENAKHPSLRLRKRGDKYEITKKIPSEGNDSSKQIEDTIPLSLEEYSDIAKAGGKRFSKKRYIYPFQGRNAEIDVYQDDLSGLVVVDFEFDHETDKDTFQMPDFCLVDVTQEEFIAGGMLCGKQYSDIEKQLEALGYQKITP
jgi:CYTH domain-containing protein